jgi:hypothetical protein
VTGGVRTQVQQACPFLTWVALVSHFLQSQNLCTEGLGSPCPASSGRWLSPSSTLGNFKAVAPLIEISIWEQASHWPVAGNVHQSAEREVGRRPFKQPGELGAALPRTPVALVDRELRLSSCHRPGDVIPLPGAPQGPLRLCTLGG